jgi:magnesium transporter
MTGFSEQSDPAGEQQLHDERPWRTLREIVEAGSPEQLDQFLESLPAGETGRAVSRLEDDEQVKLLTSLAPEKAAELIEEVSEAQAVELLELLPASDAAAILDELGSDEQADLLAELADEDVEAILAAMDPGEAANARRLARYHYETAGGLMITELLCFRDDQTVGDVLEDLRQNAEKYSDYDVQYAYVVRGLDNGQGADNGGRVPGAFSSSPADSVSASDWEGSGGEAEANAAGVRSGGRFGQLVGVLRLRDLLLGAGSRRISDVMIHDPLALSPDASLNELSGVFDRHQFLGVPVVDSARRLLGVVRRHDVEEALADRADDDNLKLLGIVGGEELRTMPLASRAGRRLAWLVPNIALNVIAISVIAVYEQTLEQVVALAVILPLISDMGGNAGVQAIAVSIRELNLGLLKAHELMWVALRESSVGLVNGVVLGVIVAVGGWVWQRNIYLGVVVGVAMTLNTLVATTVGGLMPLILKRLNVDPALASGPILTTITDMSGFFFVLSFATAVLPHLIG